MIQIGPVTAEILLIWTNVPRTNVAWTNVVVTVVICCVSKVSIPNLSLLVSLEVAYKFVVVGGWWVGGCPDLF